MTGLDLHSTLTANACRASHGRLRAVLRLRCTPPVLFQIAYCDVPLLYGFPKD